MAQIKIPDNLKAYFRAEGIDDLPTILEVLGTVHPVIIIDNQTAPALTFPGGKRVSNFETLGAVLEKRFTVSTGKRWIVSGFAYAERDVNATLNMGLYDENDKQIQILMTALAAGTTNLFFPYSLVATAATLETWKQFKGFIMEAKWYVKVTWGANQTTPEVSFPVLEMDV